MLPLNTMAPTTRESVIESIEALLVEAKNLSDDIFEDQISLQSFQRHIIRIKNNTTAPFERVFGEICFQVWSHYRSIMRLDINNEI